MSRRNQAGPKRARRAKRERRKLLRNATRVVAAINAAELEELPRIRAAIDATELPPETIAALHEVVNERAVECQANTT